MGNNLELELFLLEEKYWLITCLSILIELWFKLKIFLSESNKNSKVQDLNLVFGKLHNGRLDYNDYTLKKR